MKRTMLWVLMLAFAAVIAACGGGGGGGSDPGTGGGNGGGNGGGTTYWTKQVGTSGYEQNSHTITDASGNVYMVASTESAVTGTSAGSYDVFVVKYDAAGTEKWRKQYGGTNSDKAAGVAIDSAGNPYVAYRTFEGGSLTYATSSLIKLDPSDGSVAWTHLFSATGGGVDLKSLTIDSSNNVYVVGGTGGSMDGSAWNNRTFFLFKLDTAGNDVWLVQSVKISGGGTPIDIDSMTTDNAGNIFIAGYSYSYDASVGWSNDVYLEKYVDTGTTATSSWTKALKTTADDEAKAVRCDSSGNVYISGVTSGNLDGKANAGGKDAFVAKYDGYGTKVWVVLLGGTGSDTANGLSVDAGGNAYIIGTTSGTIDGHASVGMQDAFIAKFDTSGTKLWSGQGGSTGDDYGENIYVSGSNVYAIGLAGGAVDGNTFVGGWDVFLAKYDTAGAKQ